MQLSELKEYQDQLVLHLEASGLNVSFGDDLAVLLKTYEVATGTGYVQLPFVLEDPKDFNPYNFWVCFDDGNAPVALTGFRTMQNASATFAVSARPTARARSTDPGSPKDGSRTAAPSSSRMRCLATSAPAGCIPASAATTSRASSRASRSPKH